MKRSLLPAGLLAALWAACGAYLACCAEPAPVVPRPAEWATPIKRPGLPNLHKVSDDLYRGAQPTAEGMRELKKMGVKTVVNLRTGRSDRDALGDIPLAYEEIPMRAWHAEVEEAVRFLKLVSDNAKTPVFVHCQHGADRTGTMCAIYRITVQGWTKDEAIREMTRGGFGHHSIFKNLPRFIRRLDVEGLKRRAGIGTKEEKNP